jgi:hypothetical protein
VQPRPRRPAPEHRELLSECKILYDQTRSGTECGEERTNHRLDKRRHDSDPRASGRRRHRRIGPRLAVVLPGLMPAIVVRFRRQMGFLATSRARALPLPTRICPPCVGGRELTPTLRRAERSAAAAQRVAFGIGPRCIIRDRDNKYGPEFDRAAGGVGARVLKTPVRAPESDAVCERFLAGPLGNFRGCGLAC